MQILLVPKDRLRTGNVLGQGQFGKVLEGQVFLDEQKSVPTQVAVKVPRDGMNYSHQKALLDELKIMIYIGKHVNVLGLIGCITRHMVNL